MEVEQTTRLSKHLTDVIVTDVRDGRRYPVTYRENYHGTYHVVGIPSHRGRSTVCEAAEAVATTFMREVLDHEVVDVDEWSEVDERVAAKILHESDGWYVETAELDDDEDGDGGVFEPVTDAEADFRDRMDDAARDGNATEQYAAELNTAASAPDADGFDWLDNHADFEGARARGDEQ